MNIASAQPYPSPLRADPSGQMLGERFPDSPGVYLILRVCSFPSRGYRYHGVSSRQPLVLYVGKTTPRRTIRRRLHDHFGHVQPNYQGSQFAKILLQIIQDESAVHNILWSDDTIIACLPVAGTKQDIDRIANAAIDEFKPRLNMRGR